MLERPKPPDQEVIADAHRLAAAGADCETILLFLRERKFDKIDSIKTIRLLYNLSMSEERISNQDRHCALRRSSIWI